MKKAWITKLCNCAALLACLALSGCELFEEGETCKSPRVEIKEWTPEQGFNYTIPSKVDAPAYWRPNLGGISRKFTINNVCPVSPINLLVKVSEFSALPEKQALDYLVYVAYKYGTFDRYKAYHLIPTSIITKGLAIELVPNVAGILETELKVSIMLVVKVPYVGNENIDNALAWAKENIGSISITASFIQYR